MTPFNGKSVNSYLMEIVKFTLKFALSLTVYDIFAIQVKCKMFDLENEDLGQGEKRNLRHSTGNVWFYIGECFQNFS